MILDWVPAHFPTDEHGLVYFDGTHLYEHADPRQGIHPEWKSAIFNYGRNEVRSFLISNALFWLDRYHIDGLRVDAVASMLYLDYGRKAGEWVANQYGGRENLEAIAFLRTFNDRRLPRAPRHADHRRGVDLLAVRVAPDLHRRARLRPQVGHGLDARHARLLRRRSDRIAVTTTTSSPSAACTLLSENYVLPLSHDEVVHGKALAAGRRCRAITGSSSPTCACSTPTCGRSRARSCCFMGGEFGQCDEWNHDRSLDWHLLGDSELHVQLMALIMELNRLYKSERALHVHDVGWRGFEWVDANDADNSVYTFLRKGDAPEEVVLVRLQLRRRSRATTTGSASRSAASGARSSTPTPPRSAAAGWGTSARSPPTPSPATRARPRCASRCRRSPRSTSRPSASRALP